MEAGSCTPCPFAAQVVLLVEDSVKFYSSYLPVLYGELLAQSQAINSETMGAKEKLMRMYSRPKVSTTLQSSIPANRFPIQHATRIPA